MLVNPSRDPHFGLPGPIQYKPNRHPDGVLHAALSPGLPAGAYDLLCRTIDANGIAQPMPRPLPRTGMNAIHAVALVVKG